MSWLKNLRRRSNGIRTVGKVKPLDEQAVKDQLLGQLVREIMEEKRDTGGSFSGDGPLHDYVFRTHRAKAA